MFTSHERTTNLQGKHICKLYIHIYDALIVTKHFVAFVCRFDTERETIHTTLSGIAYRINVTLAAWFGRVYGSNVIRSSSIRGGRGWNQTKSVYLGLNWKEEFKITIISIQIGVVDDLWQFSWEENEALQRCHITWTIMGLCCNRYSTYVNLAVM